jgi:LysR family transcriptional regulator, glycine cleavage system transcriptional activator
LAFKKGCSLTVKTKAISVRRPQRRLSAPRDAFRRLPLGSLRVFVAVAEHLHFTRAAEALGVTVSAASMQIQALEQYLGVPLFRRQGRLIDLTEHGAKLLPKIRDGLSGLQEAINDARAVRGQGPLRISMLGSFLTQWLMARLPQFEKLHPDIDLRIETSTVLVDFRKSEVHAAIRLGGGSWPGLYSDKIMDEWLVPVCQPALFAKLGPVSDYADLKRYRLLHSFSERWSDWLLDGPHDDAAFGISTDDSAAIVRAAEAGGGLALARWSLVADDVRLGRLVVASKKFTPYLRTYYFVCPPKHRDMPKVAAFHSWLRVEVAKHCSPDGGPVIQEASGVSS